MPSTSEGLRTLLLVAGIAPLTSTSSEAMPLVVQKGDVMVNRGNGFQVVTGSVEVEPGSTVVVQEGGAAEFVCSESSRMAVGPGYHPVPIECATVPQEQAQAFELDTAGYLLIGAGVLGGAVTIIEGTKDSDNSASAQ